MRRRAALAGILRQRTDTILEHIVPEAVTASTSFGLTAERGNAFAQEVSQTLPLALAAVAASDAERDRLVAELIGDVRGITARYHVPLIVERGLVSIGFMAARQLLRDQAAGSGFGEEELAREYDEFQAAFEERLARLV